MLRPLEKEKREMVERVVGEWFPEEEKAAKKELKEEEKAVKAEIEKEMAKLRQAQPPPPPQEISREALRLKNMPLKTKIKNLLTLAQYRGLFFSLEIAKKTEDPLLLDLFHDILAKDRLFERFL